MPDVRGYLDDMPTRPFSSSLPTMRRLLPPGLRTPPVWTSCVRTPFVRPLALAAGLLLGAALPASAQTLRATGTPTPVLPEGFAHAVYAPGGAHLAFTTPAYQGLWVREESTGRVRLVSDAPAAGFGFAWSPDGTALAVRAARFDGRGGRADAVLMLGVDGAMTVLADFAPGVSTTPRWSDDGTAVLLPRPGGAVERFDTGRAPVIAPPAAARGAAALVVGPAATLATADGAAPRLSGLPDDSPVLAAVVSPTGDRTAVHVMGHGLFLVMASGEVLPLGEGSAPAWSPDGRHLAFMVTTDDGYDITGADVHVARADGSERWPLTTTRGVREMNPTWSPDGRALLYDDLGASRVMRLALTEAR